MTETPSVTEAGAVAEIAAKPAKSKGEKLFNRAVYGGLAGVGTFFVTLKAAYELRYGRGKGWYESSVARLAKHIPETGARIAVETTTLMQGGNLMVLPVLLAEKHKVKIVSGLNVMLGDTTPPEAVEQGPKQTAMSLIEGRALAWGVVFSTLLTAFLVLPKTYEKFTDEIAQKVHNLAGRFNWNKAAEAIKDSKSYRYGELAAIDMFATAAAATLLYVGGHFFAKRHEEKKANQPVNRSHGLAVAVETIEQDNAMAITNKDVPKRAILGEKEHIGILQQAAPTHHLLQ